MTDPASLINAPIRSIIFDIQQSLSNADYSEDLTPMLNVVADQEKEMFSGQHDSNGNPWAPLKPSTIKRKGHSRILFDKGELESSLITVGGPNNIASTDRTSLIYGTSDKKAGFHMDGTDRMPARPPVGLSDETIDKITNTVADAALRKIGDNQNG